MYNTGAVEKDNIIEVSKDKAVFWMDGDGRWRNEHGLFRHKKIIDYFNENIQKDEKGYYVAQKRGHLLEKVYFRYEETALFVVDLTLDYPMILQLNNGRELEMRPEKLLICGDSVFHRIGNEVAKFNQRAMLKLSEKLKFEQGKCLICLGSGFKVVDEMESL